MVSFLSPTGTLKYTRDQRCSAKSLSLRFSLAPPELTRTSTFISFHFGSHKKEWIKGPENPELTPGEARERTQTTN